jgi:hypothetical protein
LSAGQSGDPQRLSIVEDADNESVEELADDYQAIEAARVDGAEDAANHPERPVHTHNEYGRPDDLPRQDRWIGRRRGRPKLLLTEKRVALACAQAAISSHAFIASTLLTRVREDATFGRAIDRSNEISRTSSFAISLE